MGRHIWQSHGVYGLRDLESTNDESHVHALGEGMNMPSLRTIELLWNMLGCPNDGALRVRSFT